MKTFYVLILVVFLISCTNDSLRTSDLRIDTLSNIDSISTTKYYQNEIFSDGNLKFYGQWQFLYIYADAGIIMGPGKINPTYDYLEIKKYGIYGKVKDNKLIETGKIEIITQDISQFEIKLKPDDKDSVTYSKWYYVTYTNDSIIMRDASVGCGVSYNAYKRKN